MRQTALALCALAASGCFVVNDPGQFLSQPVPAEQFCARYAQIYCETAERCVPSVGDLSLCPEHVERSCELQFGATLRDARTSYNAEEAGLVFAQGAALAEECSGDYLGWLARRDGIAAVFEGTVAAGEDCGPTINEMREGRFDVPRFYSCRDDGACRGVDVDDWRCAQPGRAGDICSPGFAQCVDGLSCDDRGICQDNLAEPRSVCDEGSDCESRACARAAYLPGVAEVPGHCLTVEEGYRSLLGGCATHRIGFTAAAYGPVVVSDPPTVCPELGVCFTTLDDSELMGAAARTLGLPEPACVQGPDPESCPVLCSMSLGPLDESRASLLCYLSGLEPPTVSVAPIIVCGGPDE